MNSPVVRPATSEDIRFFSGAQERPTMKAWVADLDGELLGICGLALQRGRWIAFSDLNENIRPYRKALLTAGKMMMDEARRVGIRYIYTEPDPDEPSAERFLRRLGFAPDPRNPSVYRWRGDA